MDFKEMSAMLAESATDSDGRYIPWWADDFTDEECEYEDNLFTAEEIREIEECAKACGTDDMTAPVSGVGYPLFHLLVWHNFYNAVKKALDDGVDANLNDSENRGVTPLLLACTRGNLAMAVLLLDHGADASCRDVKGRNCFHYLSHPFAEEMKITEDPYYSLDQREAIARLLAGLPPAEAGRKGTASGTSCAGADPENAVSGTSCAEAGQNNAASARPIADIRQGDLQGIPPLVYLIDGGTRNICSALIDVFLEAGADPYFVDEGGGTLLLRAAVRARVTAALRLMEHRELVNRAAQKGTTPLMAAMDWREEGLCIALKDHGAEGECKLAEVDTINLARIAGNAFQYAFGRRRDNDMIALGMYLTEKLLAVAEDEEDYGCLEGILDEALQDKKVRVLDLFHEKGVRFTEPYYEGSDSVNCLRDKCLEYCSDSRVIKKLTELGVDMESAVINGRTPISILAGQHCDSEVYELFSAAAMEERDNTGRAAIHYAVSQGDAETVELMLKKGVDVNLTQDAPSEAGDTPLHLACVYGRADIAKLLLASGADDTIRNAAGETPAYYAAAENRRRRELTAKEREELFSILPHIDIPGNEGRTPLMVLMLRRDLSDEKIKLLPLLLKKGAQINRTDNEGDTALLLYARNFGGGLEMLRAFFDAGADFNAVNAEGNNVLHYALEDYNERAANYLIKKGTDYNRANLDGVTPAQIAAERGYDLLLQLMTDIR